MNDPWTFGWDQLFGLFTTLAVTAGAVAAWVGLRTWRQEQIERRQCELAEEALALVYEASDVFSSVRNPMSYGGEGSSRKQSENESDDVKGARDTDYVPIERLNYFHGFFERIISVRPRLRAIFGRDADEPLTEILKIRNEIHLAVNMLHRLDRPNLLGDEQRAEEQLQRIQKYEAIKWSMGEDDEIEPRLRQATDKIEKLVDPVLQSRYRL